MKTRHHLILAGVCITLWLLFYLAGLPFNYFQDFDNKSIFLLLLFTFFGVIPFVATIVLTFIKLPFLKTSIWLALYASLPLFILDYLLVGIISGEGIYFLVSHWYLALGYVFVWIELPLIGKTLEQLSIKIMNLIV